MLNFFLCLNISMFFYLIILVNKHVVIIFRRVLINKKKRILCFGRGFGIYFWSFIDFPFLSNSFICALWQCSCRGWITLYYAIFVYSHIICKFRVIYYNCRKHKELSVCINDNVLILLSSRKAFTYISTFGEIILKKHHDLHACPNFVLCWKLNEFIQCQFYRVKLTRKQLYVV